MEGLCVGVIVAAGGGHERDVGGQGGLGVEALACRDGAGDKAAAERVERVFTGCHALMVVDALAAPEVMLDARAEGG